MSFAAVALFLSMHCSPAATRDDGIADLDAFITRTFGQYQVPGAAIAVLQNGKAVLLKGYGVRDVTKPGAIYGNTIFQLASVTKTLTGAAAATVVDEGKLEWDTPSLITFPNSSDTTHTWHDGLPNAICSRTVQAGPRSPETSSIVSI